MSTSHRKRHRKAHLRHVACELLFQAGVCQHVDNLTARDGNQVSYLREIDHVESAWFERRKVCLNGQIKSPSMVTRIKFNASTHVVVERKAGSLLSSAATPSNSAGSSAYCLRSSSRCMSTPAFTVILPSFLLQDRGRFNES